MKMRSPSSGDGYDRLAMAAIELYYNGIHRVVVAVGGYTLKVAPEVEVQQVSR
jgi:hypothetical protein